MENEVLQKQLLVRALNYPYMAKDVVSKGISSLFPDSEMYRTFALILVRYYTTNDEAITLETLKLKLEERINLMQNSATNKLTDEESIRYFQFVQELDQTPIDSSKELVKELTKYVRDSLASQTIIKEATKLQSNKDFDIVSSLQEKLDEINSLDIDGRGSEVISVYEDTETKTDVYKELVRAKIAMGYESFDEATDGGMARGELGLIAARSGYGKTSLLTNIATKYIKRNLNVFYISLEELKSRMLLRFDKLTLNVPTSKLINVKMGNLNDDYADKTSRIYSALLNGNRLGKLSLYRNSPQSITISHLQQIIQSDERSRGIKYDVVVLDYPDLLLNPDETGNEAKDGGRIFEQLRKMAQDLNVLLWTATQLNRSSAGQDLMTIDSVEGSYRKVNTCEFVCTLNRTNEEYENGFLRLHIDKNRNRDNFLGDTMYFKYVPATSAIEEETMEEHQRHLDIVDGNSDEQKAVRQKKFAEKNKNKVETKQKQAETINQSMSIF